VSELDDDAVVQLVLAGDTDQFAILVRRYQVLVRTYCGQILGDRERGWDESQEVFLKAFNRLSSFRGDSQFSTWLMKIARNHCIDCSRKSWFRKLLSLEDAPEPSSSGPEKALEAKNLRRVVFKSLPEDQKTALLLREVEGFSYKEISDLLEISEDAVKARLKRARARARELREELEKQ